LAQTICPLETGDERDIDIVISKGNFGEELSTSVQRKQDGPKQKRKMKGNVSNLQPTRH
jgi:hypothetical protein